MQRVVPAAQARLVLERLHRAHARHHHQRRRLPARCHPAAGLGSCGSCSVRVVTRDLHGDRSSDGSEARGGEPRGWQGVWSFFIRGTRQRNGGGFQWKTGSVSPVLDRTGGAHSVSKEQGGGPLTILLSKSMNG
jgi:hypothetical protein